jgi:NAD(P)-dependent dehydrogenase (short-subunit alcohol dehydrogenase family)
MTQMRFDDDVVIVTGAGRGLGREHALAFAARGAAVVVNDIGVENLRPVGEPVVADIIAAGGRAVVDRNDVSTAKGAAALLRTALDAFGRVTVLVNNAGIINFDVFQEIDEESWRRMMQVTLDGTFHMSKAVWPLFLAQRHGRIVNTTSNAGFAGSAQLVHYGAAKLGVAGLTKALAQEAEGTGITVNAVAPMAVTRMNRDAFFGGKGASGEDWQTEIRNGTVPIGPPSAVSPTVLWLAHHSTTVSGDIYSSSSGKVARVAIVVATGHFDPDHGPEDLRDNQDRIRSLDTFTDLRSTLDELAIIRPLFESAEQRVLPRLGGA